MTRTCGSTIGPLTVNVAASSASDRGPDIKDPGAECVPPEAVERIGRRHRAGKVDPLLGEIDAAVGADTEDVATHPSLHLPDRQQTIPQAKHPSPKGGPASAMASTVKALPSPLKDLQQQSEPAWPSTSSLVEVELKFFIWPSPLRPLQPARSARQVKAGRHHADRSSPTADTNGVATWTSSALRGPAVFRSSRTSLPWTSHKSAVGDPTSSATLERAGEPVERRLADLEAFRGQVDGEIGHDQGRRLQCWLWITSRLQA